MRTLGGVVQLPTLVGLVLVLLGFFAYEIDELWPKDNRMFTNFVPLATSPELVSITGKKEAAASGAAIDGVRKLSEVDGGGVGTSSENGARRTARNDSSSSSDSSSGSARKFKTASFQERMVLVPLPTAGRAAAPLAEQMAKRSDREKRAGYAAVDTSASGPPSLSDRSAAPQASFRSN